MQEEWLRYVRKIRAAWDYGMEITARSGSDKPPDLPLPLSQGCHEIMICAPHPDDECLSGSLALRLKKPGTGILVLTFTLGSNPARKTVRQKELAAACRTLDFEARLVREPQGFDRLRPEARQSPAWPAMVEAVSNHFHREKPSLVIMPHAADGHPAHETVHALAQEAVRFHSKEQKREVMVAESEFWHPMEKPNLLLGLDEELVARLVHGLACHVGEISRNPYHLEMVARLQDNVRRLAEKNDFGGPAPEIKFGEPYRLYAIRNGKLAEFPDNMLTILPEDHLSLDLLRAFCS